jgi:type I restriction enzyme S subunit
MSPRLLSDKWRTARLDDLVTFKNGINFTKEQKGQCGIATVDVRNMYPPGIVLETDNLYDVALEVSPDYILESGDLLIVRSSVKREGVGWPVLFQEAARPTTYCGFIIRARPKIAEIDSKYLTYYLRSSTAREEVVSSSSQVTITNVNQRTLGSLQIPFPPLSEQRRIVAEIEKQFTRLEAGVAALRRVQANLKRYRASVLKAACEGNLIPGNFKSWRQINLGEVVESMKNGIYKPRSAYAEDGVACLRMYNIEQGKIVWKDIKRMILTGSEVEEYGLLSGDLLVNRVNSRELVGKAAPLPPGLETCVFESKNIRVRLKRGLADSRFISFAMGIYGHAHFNRNAQQVVGMASISQPQVGALAIPLPPLEEQTQIVAEVERRLSVVEQLQVVVSANLNRAIRLRQSMLQRAFAGELLK